MNFNYKRNLVSRSMLASSFTGSIYTFKYSHLVEPGVEGQKLPHMLLDFLPLVKLKKGVRNYITKHRRNGLNLGDQLYHVCEETGSCVIQAFSKSSY